MEVMGNDLTVIVPVYNEEKVLSAVAKHIIDYCSAKNWNVIFINDGSTDATGNLLKDIVSHPSVKVYNHKVNRGYGGAIKTGIRNATTTFIVTIDADGQHNLEDIDKLLQLAVRKDSDLVVGNRGIAGDINLYRATGKRIIRLFTRMLMPLPIEDLNSGFKMYRTELAKKYIRICPDTMAFSDIITLIFIKQHHLVLECDIAVHPRAGGRSTINTYTAIDTVMEILNIAILFNPLKFFLPISFFCIALGIIWGAIILLIVGRGVSVGSMLAIVTGVIFFVLGLLANQISALRMEQVQD